MNRQGLVTAVVVVITVLIISSVAFSHSTEAKKRKPSEVKVYVSNIGVIKQELLVRVCLADDDDCFSKEKTTNLQEHSGDKRATVATYKVTFSKEFTPGDVIACGTLNGHPHNDGNSVCSNLEKVKSKHWKSVMSYEDLLSTQ